MLVSWNYRYRDSLMDHIDPRSRFIFSFALLIAATSTWNPTLLAILFTIAILWYLSARLPFKDTKFGWLMISVMLFTMIVVNTIITDGGAGGVVPTGGQLVWPDGFYLIGRHFTFGLTVERLWFAVAQQVGFARPTGLYYGTVVPFYPNAGA
jgi:energy-coupling factor transporter transmembrane protein EcfT